jgi:hypothetical protein
MKRAQNQSVGNRQGSIIVIFQEDFQALHGANLKSKFNYLKYERYFFSSLHRKIQI